MADGGLGAQGIRAVATKENLSMESTSSTSSPAESRRPHRLDLAKPGWVLLVLLAVAVAATAESRRQRREPAVFEGYGSGLGVTAENGFSVSVVNGEWRHDGHVHVGATGSITSPWGEEMALRFWLNQDGSLGVEYDGNAILHYSFEPSGGLKEVTTVTEAGPKSLFAGDRAHRAAFGQIDVYSLDYRPYASLFEQLARNHSRDFLAGVERLERRLDGVGGSSPVGCTGDILQCTGAILLWAATVPTIAGACTAGSAFTLGAACLGAILAHEGAGVVAVGACTNAIQNCVTKDHRGDPGGGCNGPGDGPE